MASLMRCQYCGLLQDEPGGVKACERCGGELAFEAEPTPARLSSYLQAQMELDQVVGPVGRNFDRHILVSIQAPRQVPPEQSAPAAAARPPLSFIAVLDVSGSMHGEKLEQAKQAVRQALNHLQDGDVFSLVTFESEVRCVFEPVPLDAHARKVIKSALQEIDSRGMTALCGGLELGIKKAAAARRDNTLVLLLSDGQANVGVTDLELIGQRGLEARQMGIIVSTIGLGFDYNEALMAEIATQGGGRFYHVSTASEIPAYLTGELGEAAGVAAKDVKISLVIPSGSTVFPVSSAYLAQQDGATATISVGDIPCETDLEIPIRLTLPAQSEGARLGIEGNIAYRSPAGNLLSFTLNRVMVRCAKQGDLDQREGVVLPVAEVVYRHLRAANVLNVSKASARSPVEMERQVREGVSHLHGYAVLLGEQRAKEELKEVQAEMDGLLNPVLAKPAVHAAHAIHRSSKKFGQG